MSQVPQYFSRCWLTYGLQRGSGLGLDHRGPAQRSRLGVPPPTDPTEPPPVGQVESRRPERLRAGVKQCPTPKDPSSHHQRSTMSDGDDGEEGRRFTDLDLENSDDIEIISVYFFWIIGTL